MFAVFSLATGQNGVALYHNGSSFALGSANTGEQRVTSSALNPAAMVYTGKLYASVGVMQSFFLEGLYYSNLEAVFKVQKTQALGLQLYYGGSSLFNEIQIAPSYALRLADHTSLGLRLHGILITSPENDKLFAGTFTMGAQTQLSKQFALGISTFNPVGFFSSIQSNDLTHFIQMGVSYQPVDYLTLLLAGNLQGDHPFKVSGGIRYELTNRLNFMISASANPGIIGFGIGVPIGRSLMFDVTGAQHLQLGFSPAINVGYER